MSELTPISLSNVERTRRAESASRRRDVGRNAEVVGRIAEDQVEVSDVGYFMAVLRKLPEIRQDLVDAVKAKIESGTYESPDKVEAAIEEAAKDLNW